MVESHNLYVLRHAKSSWDDPSLPDHDRPLAARGRRAVTVLAEYVQSREIRPDLVLCSTARRTRETLDGVRPGGRTLTESTLYRASCPDLIERLRSLPSETGSVMVIGHNPALQGLVLRLASRDDSNHAAGSDALSDIRRKLPTGALATLAFGCDWSQLESGCAELVDYMRPKALLYQ